MMDALLYPMRLGSGYIRKATTFIGMVSFGITSEGYIMKLLAEQSSNAKLRKNSKYSDRIRSYIMYMKPDRAVCPMSQLAGCEA